MNPTRPYAAGPWSPEMRLRVVAFNVVGLALAALGWYQCAGSDRPGPQLRWLEVGVAGFAIAVIGNGWWVLGGRRAVGVAARQLFGADLPAQLVAATGMRTVAPDKLVAAPGTRRYHRPGCSLLSGHPIDTLDLLSRDDHEENGRRACEVCRP